MSPIPKGQRRTTFAEKVRWMRGAMTHAEYARVCGISAQRLEEMESGKGPEYQNKAERVFNAVIMHNAPAYTLDDAPPVQEQPKPSSKPAIKPMGFARLFEGFKKSEA